MEESLSWCLGMSMDLSICFSGLPALSSLLIASTRLQQSALCTMRKAGIEAFWATRV